jgi:hypothetical protein
VAIELISHNALRFGIAGFEPSLLNSLMNIGKSVDTSSSHTFSTVPLRTKAQSEHVILRRMRHQLEVNREYIGVFDSVDGVETGGVCDVSMEGSREVEEVVDRDWCSGRGERR